MPDFTVQPEILKIAQLALATEVIGRGVSGGYQTEVGTPAVATANAQDAGVSAQAESALLQNSVASAPPVAMEANNIVPYQRVISISQQGTVSVSDELVKSGV
jgi:hypothetical protein